MRLHCEIAGRGTEVVLLHGFPLDGRMWEPLADRLFLSHRVIVPDLRGFGRSALSVEPVATVEAMAADVIETLDALGLEHPVVLGGLSMGGYVAQTLALEYPERWRALLLMDTRAAADTPEAARGREESARGVLETGRVEALVAGMVPRLFAAGTSERHPGLVAELTRIMESSRPGAVAAALRGLAARPDRTGRLGEIAMSTLVLAGEEDAISPPAEGRAMAAAIPRGRFVEIPRAGHMAPCENPEAVYAAIADFLASSSSRA
jgi:pimeloyl-ACP methyl ester carboxylesterase